MPVQEAVVEVDVSTLEQSASGSMTGVIAIRIDATSFPEARWSDFPVVILGWWLESAPRVLDGTARSWRCRFMDGPFSAHLKQDHEDTWTLAGNRESRVELSGVVSSRAFIRSLLDAASQILQACAQRGWRNRDVETLESAVRAVQPTSSFPKNIL